MYQLSSSSKIPYLYALYTALNGAGTVLCEAPLLRLVEESFCRSYYLENDPTLVDRLGDVEERYCKVDVVQSELATLVGWDACLMAVAGLLVAPLYAHISTRFERRWIILAGMFSWVASTTWVMLVAYCYQFFGIRAILLGNAFTLIGGGPSVTFSVVQAIIADEIPQSSLSSALYYIRALDMFVNVGIRAFTGSLMTINLWLPVLVGLPIYSLALPILLVKLNGKDQKYDAIGAAETDLCGDEQQSAGVELDQFGVSTMEEISNQNHKSIDPHKGFVSSSSNSLLDEIRQSIVGSYNVCRYLIIENPAARNCLGIYLLDSLASNTRDIIPQYASRNFGWTIAETNYLLSFRSATGGVLLILLPTLGKLMRSRGMNADRVDFRVACGSMLLFLAGCIILGLSWARTTFVVGLATYSFGTGFHDALKSYSTTKVGDDKITQLYIGIATAARLGSLVGGPMWAALFVVAINAGGWMFTLPFWIAAGIWLCIGFCLFRLRSRSR